MTESKDIIAEIEAKSQEFRAGDANYFELFLPELVANFSRVMQAYQAAEADDGISE